MLTLCECKTVLAAIGLAGSLVAAPTGATAQIFDNDLYVGGKARVNLSAKLRALSEDVTATTCRLNAGIDVEDAREELRLIRSDFSAILDGLEDGNAALGIPTPETNSRNLQLIEGVRELWSPIGAASERILAGSGSANDTRVINENYRELFELTIVLASDIAGVYSNPQELLQSDATVLNFVGRQTTFVNRMTRAVCGLAIGSEELGTLEELRETVDLFERSLIALRDGFPNAGINPPPNDAVRGSLEDAYQIWSARRGVFDALLAGQPATAQMVEEANDLGRALSVAIENTTTLYLIAAPGQEGVYRVPLQAYAEDELSRWLVDQDLIDAINNQNRLHADLSEDEIIALDQQWRAEADNGGGPLINRLLAGPVSQWLKEQQDATAGLVTEVFVMDNKGLNVAQSVETSDYWQGDEAKWKETYGREDGDLHISDVEFDDSTGFYQTQASLLIVDPATRQPIGAITFGINIQRLM